MRTFLSALILAFCFAAPVFCQKVTHPTGHNELVIRNATLLTVTHGRIENGSVYVKDGKIVAFGTLNPAEIWGVAAQLGSLDVGKTVADGDPLDVRTDVNRVFIAGHEVPLESPQTHLRDAYMK